MSHSDDANAPVTMSEIGDVLADIRALGDGTLPASEREAVMARKRALIERLEPGFYDSCGGGVRVEVGDGGA
jgi:hypothetical protein